MKTRLVSLDGSITVLAVALLTFLGRTFVDFQFVYSGLAAASGKAALATLNTMALFGVWLWGLLAATRGSRRALTTAWVFNLLFLFGIGFGTLVSYCPSPCQTAWPLMEIANWANVITGAIAAVAVGAYLWRRPRPI